MDLFFYASGIGKQNRELTPDIELATVETNGLGFTRMIGCAYRYFAQQGVAIKVISGDNPATVSDVACRAGIENAERSIDAQLLAWPAADSGVLAEPEVVSLRRLYGLEEPHSSGHYAGQRGLHGLYDPYDPLRHAGCAV